MVHDLRKLDTNRGEVVSRRRGFAGEWHAGSVSLAHCFEFRTTKLQRKDQFVVGHQDKNRVAYLTNWSHDVHGIFEPIPEGLGGHPTYFSRPGIKVSTLKHAADFDASSVEVKVLIDPEDPASFITVEDVQAGVWQEAEVYHYVVDPRRPWLGVHAAFHWIAAHVRYEDGEAIFDLVGFASYFLQQRQGDTFGPRCRNIFGEGQCDQDGLISGNPNHWFKSYTVLPGSTGYRELTVSIPQASAPPGLTSIDWGPTFFNQGTIIMVGGKNDGWIGVVRSNGPATLVSGAYEIDLVLATPMPHVIDATSVRLRPGCSRERRRCSLLFGNGLNFRPGTFTAGTDAVEKTPDTQ